MMTIHSKLPARTALWQALLCLPIIGCSTLAHSSAYQTFLGLNYSNPAELSNTKNYQLIVGGDEVFQDVTYRGTYQNAAGKVTYGSAKSGPNDYLPNGRIAFRVNDRVVFGVDVTQPLYTDFQYPKNSFIRNASITTYLRTTEFSPRVAWKATDKLSLGVGFNAMYAYAAELSTWLASGPISAQFTNQGNPTWGYGMNMGLFYAVKKGTYVGFSYFSKVGIRGKSGVSTWGPFVSEQYNTSTLIAPETYNLNLTQYVSPTWLFNAILRYNVWNPQSALYLNDTAIPKPRSTVTFTQNYFNAFRYALSTKYEFNSKWAGILGAEYSPTSQSIRDRGLGLPVTAATVVAVGAQMVITPGLTARVLASHVFANPNIDLAYSNGRERAVGNVKIQTNTVGFRITYES